MKAGQQVYVRSFSKVGTILEERKPGSFAVQVGELSVVCNAADLSTEIPERLRTPKKKAAARSSVPTPPSPSSVRALDLHGKTVAEAIELAERYISDQALAGYGRLELVHGIGHGRLREALHRHLKTLPVVKRFSLDDRNAGVTLVFLDA